MFSTGVFVFATLLELAVFEAALSQQGCGENLTEEVRDFTNLLNAIDRRLDSIEKKMEKSKYGVFPSHAASSCAEILLTNPASLSGYYWVNNGTGHPHSVYCDMTRSCGGVTGGWMRVAYLDMTNSSHECPSGLRLRSGNFRICVPGSHSATCSSVPHSSHGVEYSRVCGKIHAFQIKSVDGFTGSSIDANYLDGVSLTHGEAPRNHIWSFAAGPAGGPCSTPPAFVSNDYFNDQGETNYFNDLNPLWDGVGCGTNACCHLNNPPWFHKQLPRPTADDIEMRVCRDQERRDEDVGLHVVEIYIA